MIRSPDASTVRYGYACSFDYESTSFDSHPDVRQLEELRIELYAPFRLGFVALSQVAIRIDATKSFVAPIQEPCMQVFGNVATQPERKTSKATGKRYIEFRMAESQKGVDTDPTWYTVRVMRDQSLELNKGDFVRVTGKLKADYYLSREGKPTGTLLVIAFEAQKISKPTRTATDVSEVQAQSAA